MKKEREKEKQEKDKLRCSEWMTGRHSYVGVFRYLKERGLGFLVHISSVLHNTCTTRSKGDDLKPIGQRWPIWIAVKLAWIFYQFWVHLGKIIPIILSISTPRVYSYYHGTISTYIFCADCLGGFSYTRSEKKVGHLLAVKIRDLGLLERVVVIQEPNGHLAARNPKSTRETRFARYLAPPPVFYPNLKLAGCCCARAFSLHFRLDPRSAILPSVLLCALFFCTPQNISLVRPSVRSSCGVYYQVKRLALEE